VVRVACRLDCVIFLMGRGGNPACTGLGLGAPAFFFPMEMVGVSVGKWVYYENGAEKKVRN